MSADDERHRWLNSLDDFEVNLLLGFLIGCAPEEFDQARAYVERIRAGAPA